VHYERALQTLAGLAEPEEALEAFDMQEMRRFEGGDHEFDKILRPLTSNGLCNIAHGQLAYAQAEWERIKTEPGYLRSIIINRVRTTAELFPDEGTGTCPTARALLDSPRYVGMQVRYVVHGALLTIAHWSVLLEYFRDIKALDDEFGRYGKLSKRIPLMCQVKKLMDGMQVHRYKAFLRMAGCLPEWKSYGFVTKRYKDYAGAQLVYDFANYPNFEQVLEEPSLKGVFSRMLTFEPVGGRPFDGYLLDEISKEMAKVSEVARQGLGSDVLDAWTNLAQLSVQAFR